MMDLLLFLPINKIAKTIKAGIKIDNFNMIKVLENPP